MKNTKNAKSVNMALFVIAAGVTLLVAVSGFVIRNNDLREDKICRSVDFEIESVCLNPAVTELNSKQPTIDISLKNKGMELNGLFITVDGKPHTKLFRTMGEGSFSLLQIPVNSGQSFSSIELQPLLVLDKKVVYCELYGDSFKGDIKYCVQTPLS